MSPHVSTLTLHRYRYGELDGERLAETRRHLAECEACAGQLQGQQNQRAAFELQPVPERIRRAARRPVWQELLARWGTWVVPALVAAGLVAAVGVRGLPTNTGGIEAGPSERLKGERGQLEVVRASDGAVVGSGGALLAGDSVQLRVRGEPGAWVTLVGVDGAGAPQVFGAFRLEGGWQAAPFALQIDGASPRQEFVAVFSEGPTSEHAALSGLAEGVRVGFSVR